MLAQGFGTRTPISLISSPQLTKSSPKLWRPPRNSLPPRSCRSRNFPRQYVYLSAAPSKLVSSSLTEIIGFYLISFWYKREEAQKRFTFYWCSVLIASAFGGLFASAIANMDGVGGYSNWRWVFILEGILTIIIGVVAYFTLADFPEQAKWLTEDERGWVITRTGRDKEGIQKIGAKDILRFFSDFKNILAGIVYFGKTSTHQLQPLEYPC